MFWVSSFMIPKFSISTNEIVKQCDICGKNVTSLQLRFSYIRLNLFISRFFCTYILQVVHECENASALNFWNISLYHRDFSATVYQIICSFIFQSQIHKIEGITWIHCHLLLPGSPPPRCLHRGPQTSPQVLCHLTVRINEKIIKTDKKPNSMNA